MSKTIEIPDIAMWEETDSELAKYTIQSLSSLIKNQEEQLNANDLMIDEMIDRIDKAIEFLEHEQFKRIQLGFGRNEYLENIKNKAIDILRGKDENE